MLAYLNETSAINYKILLSVNILTRIHPALNIFGNIKKDIIIFNAFTQRITGETKTVVVQTLNGSESIK